MAKKRTIHVVGTGTLGEPLVNLLLDMKEDVAVDEITFHKNTPRVSDRTRIQSLVRRGGKLVADSDKMTDFEKVGLPPAYTHQDALAQASVVIDCSSEGLGLKHKDKWYKNLSDAAGLSPRGVKPALTKCTPTALTMTS